MRPTKRKELSMKKHYMIFHLDDTNKNYIEQVMHQ